MANALQVHDITEQVRDEKNKSVLLSSVSHDLRTPLTTIKAAVTGLLQPDVDWDEQTRREILEEIDAEADHLTSLVDAVVEMSRIEMGALVLEKEFHPEFTAHDLVNLPNLPRVSEAHDRRSGFEAVQRRDAAYAGSGFPPFIIQMEHASCEQGKSGPAIDKAVGPAKLLLSNLLCRYFIFSLVALRSIRIDVT